MKSKTVLPGVFAEALYLVTGFSTAGAEADVGKLPRASGREVVFAADIKPILERSCFQCHGPTRPKGRFRVDSREAILKGGESDQAAIIPGKSASSPLVQYVAGLVKEMEMPPLDKRDKYPPLAQDEIALFRAWVDQGAKWPEGVSHHGALVA